MSSVQQPDATLKILVAIPPVEPPAGTERGGDRSLTLLSDYMHPQEKVEEVKVSKLANEVKKFCDSIQVILDAAITETKQYQLESVSIAAEVSAEGSLMIQGMGIKGGGKTGMTFVFKRLQTGSVLTEVE
jgi:hypothetical protein